MDADNALWPVSVGTAGDRNVRVLGCGSDAGF